MSIRIGDLGEAVSSLAPSGKVRIHGILYDAKSEGMFIEAGAHCIVIRQDPFALIVRKLEGDLLLPQVANSGNPITKSEAQRTSEEVRQVEATEAEAGRQIWWKEFKKGLLISAILGLVVAGFTSFLSTSNQTRQDINKTLTILGLLVIGPIWGMVLYLAIEGIPSMIVKLKESEGIVLQCLVISFGLIAAGWLFHWRMIAGEDLLRVSIIALLGSIAITFVAWFILKWLSGLVEIIFG